MGEAAMNLILSPMLSPIRSPILSPILRTGTMKCEAVKLPIIQLTVMTLGMERASYECIENRMNS